MPFGVQRCFFRQLHQLELEMTKKKRNECKKKEFAWLLRLLGPKQALLPSRSRPLDSLWWANWGPQRPIPQLRPTCSEPLDFVWKNIKTLVFCAFFLSWLLFHPWRLFYPENWWKKMHKRGKIKLKTSIHKHENY